MHGLAPLPRPNLLRCNTIRGPMPLLALCFAHSPWGWAPFADLPLPRRRRIPLRRGPLAATVVGLARASRRVPMRARRRGRAACAACRATNPIVSTTVPLCAIPRHHVAAIRTREVSRGSGKTRGARRAVDKHAATEGESAGQDATTHAVRVPSVASGAGATQARTECRPRPTGLGSWQREEQQTSNAVSCQNLP